MKNNIRLSSLQFLFLISGFAALVYQVAWQRALFTVLGSDIDSTTIITAIFMSGLGLGAILGGQISQKFATKNILFFSLLEVSTGIYGFISLDIIERISHLPLSNSIMTSLYAALALFVPTLFMGATLPVLVNHINKQIINAGTSVATLYFVNTLGGAIASILTMVVAFELLGLQGTVYLAASLNILIALLVWVRLGREQ
ncbi:MAG: hypothetical protein GY786_01595 [Proteobacteria bacterium]|nr:hypothetical protein [Pseudomonadota bacterium]